MTMPYCVGLTGGIGSGKSSAARLFEALDAGIVDVDDISHALTQPGGAAIKAIRGQFGSEYITSDGPMDRKRTQAAHATQPYLLVIVTLLLERDAYGDPRKPFIFFAFW